MARGEDGRAGPIAEVTSWPLRTLLGGPASRAFGCVAALSPDGRRLATARHRATPMDATTVRIWDVATGRLVRTVEPSGMVEELAWSPDGRTLAAVGGTLSAWDVESGAVLGWGRGTSGGFTTLAFAPVGGALAVPTKYGRLDCRDGGDGHVRATLPALAPEALAFSPDGNLLAVGDDNSDSALVTIFELKSRRPETVFRGHERPSRRVEEARLWANRELTRLKIRAGIDLWSLARSVTRLTGNVVCAVAFSPDGRLVASGDSDGTARVWDAATGAEVARFDHGEGASWASLGLATAWAAICGAAAYWCRGRAGRVLGRAIAS